MEEHLLSGEEKEEKWSSYQYIGRTNSIIPTASSARTEVSVDEIRSATAVSDHYPPSIHAALLSSPEPDPDPREQVIVYQGGLGGGPGGNLSNEVGRQVLDEIEIRELLVDHVGHRCCWGSRPARTWKICTVEDCNVYVGTLESFIEERETIRETEPYLGGKVDGKENGPELGIWELDLRSEFPLLFVPHKETRAKIPHSEAVEKCSGCTGRGEIPCHVCNAGKEPGFFKENQMTQCTACHGRGLIAHKDGSDTLCVKCKGNGKLPCAICGSRGLIKCTTCQGGGALLTRNVSIVRCCRYCYKWYQSHSSLDCFFFQFFYLWLMVETRLQMASRNTNGDSLKKRMMELIQRQQAFNAFKQQVVSMESRQQSCFEVTEKLQQTLVESIHRLEGIHHNGNVGGRNPKSPLMGSHSASIREDHVITQFSQGPSVEPGTIPPAQGVMLCPIRLDFP